MTRSIWAWARLLGGAGILALVMWRLGTGAFLDGLRVLDAGALAVALGIGAATTVLSAWRWCLVARSLGLKLSLRAATADYYQALFLNAALPGGVLGDVGRAVQHGREEGDVGRGVRAVVLERTAGQFVLLFVGALVLLLVPSPVLTLLKEHAAATAAVSAGVLLAGGLALFGLRRLSAKKSHDSAKKGRAAKAARTGISEIRVGLLSRRNGPGVLFASAAVLAGHLATFVIAARAAGSAASLLQLAPLLLLALIAMGLPVNVGGWGPREGVMAWAFGAAGLSAAQGLTIAVAYGILAFVAAAPGAAIVVVRLLARRTAQPVVTAPQTTSVRHTVPVPRTVSARHTAPTSQTSVRLTAPALQTASASSIASALQIASAHLIAPALQTASAHLIAPVSPAPVMAARPIIVPAPIPVRSLSAVVRPAALLPADLVPADLVPANLGHADLVAADLGSADLVPVGALSAAAALPANTRQGRRRSLVRQPAYSGGVAA
ncbi:uncharacterized protein (TIRG00374 family) [Actinoplanes lutulentus]|uniref:Uncharacterized protein (TIRG00374 family) n=1 Tax=Actinoplanes lutulentus TaxID=1287878 RepID=A0A327Z439_9ACTN|nr:uncharacterized protein (TIRG00374 family) [Actinoplanes lutulentus]RAK29260.1 uncharacterized protein (TIRG00374 family) [Actinoplanes lutulentus]